MNISLAQINPTVGDFEGNLALIREAAIGEGSSLVVFPELCVCGYMPRDLLEEPSFLDSCDRVVAALAADRDLPPLLVGAPVRAEGPGKPLSNAALLIRDGRVETVAKRLLPTYDVFDERRYFRAGSEAKPVEVGGLRIGVTVCEDIWEDDLYHVDPVADLAKQRVDWIVNLSASPYEHGKPEERRRLVRAHMERHGIPMALCNLVGGNDQLIFDGNSFAFGPDGETHLAHCRAEVAPVNDGSAARPDRIADAIVLGIRDYFAKTGFHRAIVGMSGGVDSSVVACLAVEALGADNVMGVGMPGPYNAPMSFEDARTLAERLSIRFEVLPIDAPFDAIREVMRSEEIGLPEENMQARIRGTYLMTLSNRDGALVLVPSNKSEMALGYCTLYGDMVGALAPISDLYKGEVYELAREYEAIPQRVLDRPPSAELRPDQTDQDTLPPYEVLDPILKLHLEERLRPDEIVERGFDARTVERILRGVSVSEYKRQQAAPVLKVSRKAFDLGRRFPIVERFRGGTRWR
ncbi:MAG: NAD+ synthase [Planctomycetota bacterium]|jgi:NAD+ synthetase